VCFSALFGFRADFVGAGILLIYFFQPQIHPGNAYRQPARSTRRPQMEGGVGWAALADFPRLTSLLCCMQVWYT